MPETIYNQSALSEPITYQKITPNNPKEPADALVQMRSILETGVQQNQSMNEITEKVYQLTLEHPELVTNQGVPETFEGIKNGIVKPYYEATRPGLGAEYFEFQVSEQELTLYDKDGNIVAKHSAESGPWGKGALPVGEYSFRAQTRDKKQGDENYESFCDPSRNCWSQWIEPEFKTGRKELAMHPDGGKDKGTSGCIGLEDHNTLEFRHKLDDLLTLNPKLKLTVKP